ncbi:MAG: acylneuraminate cytidylyltransferase family protein [Thermoplasmatales archaeon]|nr:acylneuraminate cytidylyltransferase family protein [Thermoplasmatales archaeon]
MKNNKIIAIIPARGGSKGIPKKNLVDINGKPLISYTIQVAKQSNLIDRVIVSTDNDEIADVSKKYGAEIPFIRPSELAQDHVPTYPVIRHTLEWLEEKEQYQPDIVVILEPTFPLRTTQEVDKAIKMMMSEKNADSLRGVIEPFQNPYKMWTLKGKYLEPLLEEGAYTHKKPRQTLEKVYWQNGYIYISRYKTLMEKGNIHGEKILPFVLDSDKFIDIDTEEDLKLLKCIMKK